MQVATFANASFAETVTASVFSCTKGIAALPTLSLNKVGAIFQASSPEEKFDNSSPSVPKDVMSQDYKATVSSVDVVDDVEKRPEWEGVVVSRDEEPSVKVSLGVKFSGEWVTPMEQDKIEFHNSDGSVVCTPAMMAEEPPCYSPYGDISHSHHVYPSSVVYTMYYTNDASMQFIKPNEGIKIVAPKNADIYKKLFDEIDTGQRLDYNETAKVLIPCFKVPEQKMSLVDHLSGFPSLFNKDGTFLRNILKAPESVAYIKSFDVTTSLTVDEKGTVFSAMMDFDAGVDRGGSCATDFILDGPFLYRIVYKNKANGTNTVLVSGIVTDLQ